MNKVERAGWAECPTCGRRLRVRWWRRFGHRLRYPIFEFIYLGRIIDFFAGSPTMPDHEEYPRKDFWIACPSCKGRVVIEYGL